MIIECIKALLLGTFLGIIITVCRMGLPAPTEFPPYFIIFGYYVGYKVACYFI